MDCGRLCRDRRLFGTFGTYCCAIFQKIQELVDICSHKIIEWIRPAKPFLVNDVDELLKRREVFLVKALPKFPQGSRFHDYFEVVVGQYLISCALQLFK